MHLHGMFHSIVTYSAEQKRAKSVEDKMGVLSIKEMSAVSV